MKSQDTVQTLKELRQDLHTLVAETEKIMGASLAERKADAVSTLRKRFGAAQERFTDIYNGWSDQDETGLI